MQLSNQYIYRGLTLRVVGFVRLLLFFGDNTSAGAVFRDAARVERATGLETTGCFATVVAARARFLDSARSETFSLSSPATSSLPRFLPRVTVDALGTDLE